MGFLSWLFCAILVVALVLLLFPFAFRIDFEAGERGVRALFFFFKKKIYEYEKKWKEEAGSKELAVEGDERLDAPPVEVVAKKPAETPKTELMELGSRKSELGIDESEKQESSDIILNEVENTPEKQESSDVVLSETKDPVKSSVNNEDALSTEVKSSSVVEVSSGAKVAESAKPDDEKLAEEPKPKKEKRKLSDREFWTIILTPDFDARAFKYILKILKAVLTLFRVRFSDCFVEGIRSDYQTMGYIAAVNGFLKAYPYVGDWDLRMDWCNEKELRAAGSVRLSITLLRIFCFTLETLVLAGILAFSFWRRRAHVIKTNELPQLGFIRKRILEFILED